VKLSDGIWANVLSEQPRICYSTCPASLSPHRPALWLLRSTWTEPLASVFPAVRSFSRTGQQRRASEPRTLSAGAGSLDVGYFVERYCISGSLRRCASLMLASCACRAFKRFMTGKDMPLHIRYIEARMRWRLPAICFHFRMP